MAETSELSMELVMEPMSELERARLKVCWKELSLAVLMRLPSLARQMVDL
jgi:hypothetical protein